MNFRQICATAMPVMLGFCATVEPTTCPAPDGLLLLTPAPLPQLHKGEDAITAWLNDIEAYRNLAFNTQQLQVWGREQCGWPPIDTPAQ